MHQIKVPESLTRQAYRVIRDQILSGKLDLRQRLTEEYFASTFNISKSPVREALNQLEAEDLVKIEPRRGAFVIDFSVQDVQEIYELREILESAVVHSVELDAKTLARLREAADRAEEYRAKGEKINYVRADAAFHFLLAQASGNSRLRKAVERIHNQAIILRHRTYEQSSELSLKQHREILELLEAGKREEAAAKMVEHIRSVRDRLLSSMPKDEL